MKTTVREYILNLGNRDDQSAAVALLKEAIKTEQIGFARSGMLLLRTERPLNDDEMRIMHAVIA